MRWRTILAYSALVLGGFVVGTGMHLGVLERCPPPTTTEQARLVAAVRQKYRLPISADLGIADGGAVAGSCFRRLVYANLAGPPFRAELFSSPDFRFLTTDLFPSNPDMKLLAEQRRHNAEVLADGAGAIRGETTAATTLVEFSDFQCPFCAGMAKVLDRVLEKESGRMRVIYRHFPLSIHPWARPAAEAAACSQQQSNASFWSLHDFLFTHQRELSAENLRKRVMSWAATDPKLDRRSFEKCVSGSLTSAVVEHDVALGQELGVHRTPTLFLNGELISGSSIDEIVASVRSSEAIR